MTSVVLRAKPIVLALSLVTLMSAGVAQAQSKEDQIARMTSLQAQIDALKPQRTPESSQQLNALQNEFGQISASMGGDVPCGIGSGQPNSVSGLITVPPGCTPTTTGFTNTTPVAIPTGPGVVTSTIAVSGAGSYLWDLNLTTGLQHTFAADLDITITSPAGTVVTLTTDNGAGNDNVFDGTVWDDDANPGGTVPYTTNNGMVTDHAYANLTLASPLVPEEALGAFVGEDPNGTWTITISDDLAGDGGTLNSWGLSVTTFPNPVISDAAQTFAQTTPVAIPTGPAVVTSTLSVGGLTNRVCRARLTSNITHTFAADIDATLTSPAGTVITLTTDNGAGNDNVFNGTLWDDDANPAGQVPYTTNNGVVTDNAYANLTTATPLVVEESLSALLGEDGNGTWTLTVSDDLAGDGGSIDSWALELTTCTCEQADLAITLTDAPDPVNAGTNLSYTATSTNNGPSAANNVQISLPMPAGTTFVSATPTAGGTCTTPAVGANGTVSCTWAGATANAASQNVVVVVGVPSGATGNLSATATTTSTTADPSAANNSATATTVIAVLADLGITLTDAPDPATAGTNLVYTATVTNAGPSDATGVTITFPVPASTSFVSGSVTPAGSCAGSPVVCTVTGALLPGTSATATITVLVDPATPNNTVINASATAGAASPDGNAANNTANTTTTVNASADLALTFSASSTAVLINVPVTFNASATNNGPSAAQDASITITLSPDFRYSGHVASAGATCTTPQVGLSGPVTCTWAGATAVGAVRTLEVTAYSFTEGTSSISASTTSPTPDPVANNNALSQSVVVGSPVENIPTLDRAGLLLLGLLLGMIGFAMLRRG